MALVRRSQRKKRTCLQLWWALCSRSETPVRDATCCRCPGFGRRPPAWWQNCREYRGPRMFRCGFPAALFPPRSFEAAVKRPVLERSRQGIMTQAQNLGAVPGPEHRHSCVDQLANHDMAVQVVKVGVGIGARGDPHPNFLVGEGNVCGPVVMVPRISGEGRRRARNEPGCRGDRLPG